MTDIAIAYDNDNQFGDLILENSDLKRDEGLESAVLISLFTDRRVSPEDVLEGDTYLGGYVFEVPGDIVYGSRIFTLDRSKTDLDTVRLLQSYAAEALVWMTDDGLAGSIETKAIRINGSRIDLSVKIFKDGNEILNMQFQDLWNAQFNPPVFVNNQITVAAIIPLPEVSQWYNHSIPTTPGSPDNYDTITYGDGVFMMFPDSFSSSTYVTISTDGVNFSEIALFPDRLFGPYLAYGDGTFVVIKGIDALNRYSTDGGLTWTAGNLPVVCEGLAFGNGVFVAGERSGKRVYVSADGGATWSLSNLPTISGANYNTANVTYCEDGVFTIISPTHAFVSEDSGTTWTGYELHVGMTGFNIHTTNAYGNGALLVSAFLRVWISGDKGKTWIESPHTPTFAVEAYSFGDGIFTAVTDGANGVWTSADDGLSWTNHTITGGANDIAYGNSIFVGCRATGTDRALSNIPPYFEHLWLTSSYTTMYKDSYNLPAAQLPDQLEIGNNLTVHSLWSDSQSGSDITGVIPIVHSTSAPDGTGVLYPADVPAWLNNSGESGIMDVDTAININGTGAISFGGWLKSYSFIDGSQIKDPVAQQGGVWNNVQSAPSNFTLAAYGESDATDPLAPTQRYGIYIYFDGVGMVELKSSALPYNKWTHVWYQLTNTRAEIWIDGVLDAFIEPVGATALNVSTTNKFTLFQSKGSAAAGWKGGIGEEWYMYSRALSEAEVGSIVDSATNIDMGTKLLINDAGAGVCPSTNDLVDPVTWYYPDYKTASTWDIDADTGLSIPYGSGPRSVRNHLATPVYRGGDKTECQLRITDNIVDFSGYLLIGFDMKERGENTTLLNLGLGSIAKSYGFDCSNQRMMINGSYDANPDSPALSVNDVVTVRIDPTTPTAVTYEILVNNVSKRNGTIGVGDYEAHGRIYFTIGRREWGGYEDQRIEILSNDSDAAYTLGSGYKFLESV